MLQVEQNKFLCIDHSGGICFCDANVLCKCGAKVRVEFFVLVFCNFSGGIMQYLASWQAGRSEGQNSGGRERGGAVAQRFERQ